VNCCVRTKKDKLVETGLPGGMANGTFRCIFFTETKIMKISSLFFMAVAFAGAQIASAADITGTVTLKGTPPAERDITVIKSDPNCGRLVKEVPKTKFYVVGPNAELADVFVTLKGISGKSTGASAPPLIIDQVACEYIPYIAAAQTGQKIVVKNSDPILHNVHPTPVNTAGGNREANKAQMPLGPDLEFVFPAPENFLRFKCDVHPWMFTYVSIVDHPYFAVTGKDGTFKIENVPPGKYTVAAYHRKGTLEGVEKEIEVKEGEPAKVDFTIEAK
jgi:hypothetical protein